MLKPLKAIKIKALLCYSEYHSGSPPPPAPFVKGGDWIFELNKIFQNQEGAEKEGGGIFEILIGGGGGGGELLEMKLQTESKISE